MFTEYWCINVLTWIWLSRLRIVVHIIALTVMDMVNITIANYLKNSFDQQFKCIPVLA